MRLIVVYLKGLCMGAADIVPGVSGGTMALITNIYEELIRSINNLTYSSVKKLFSSEYKTAWKTLNGSFLMSLALGIGTSIMVFGSSIQHLLVHHPIALWSFFFGLILMSALLIGKQIQNRSWIVIGLFFLGMAISLMVGFLSPVQASTSLPYLFLCGMLAIVAMILPGISGAFILILLGAYDTALETLTLIRGFKTQGFVFLAAFALGGIIGLKAFAKLLNGLYQNHKNRVLSLLVGFMLGSLYKVWPWKKNVAIGNDDFIREIAIWPDLTMDNHSFWLGVPCAIAGAGLIMLFEFVSKRKKT
jgi:putative membrane protein